MAETITQITQPAPFIEAAAKPFISELQQAVGQFKGADLSNMDTGESIDKIRNNICSANV